MLSHFIKNLSRPHFKQKTKPSILEFYLTKSPRVPIVSALLVKLNTPINIHVCVFIELLSQALLGLCQIWLVNESINTKYLKVPTAAEGLRILLRPCI